MSILRQLNLDGKQLNDMFYNQKLSLQNVGSEICLRSIGEDEDSED